MPRGLVEKFPFHENFPRPERKSNPHSETYEMSRRLTLLTTRPQSPSLLRSSFKDSSRNSFKVYFRQSSRIVTRILKMILLSIISKISDDSLIQIFLHKLQERDSFRNYSGVFSRHSSSNSKTFSRDSSWNSS